MGPFDPRLPVLAKAAGVRVAHVFYVISAIKEQGKHFHAEACAQFTSLETRHVEAILSTLQEHDCMPGKTARTSSFRGTRLPNDWKIPDDWVKWASAKRKWHPADVLEEAEKFARYWQCKTGSNATKLDWFKTFQNWVSDSRKVDGDYSPAAAPKSPTERAESLRKTIALYEQMGRESETGEMKRELARLEPNVLPFERKAG